MISKLVSEYRRRQEHEITRWTRRAVRIVCMTLVRCAWLTSFCYLAFLYQLLPVAGFEQAAQGAAEWGQLMPPVLHVAFVLLLRPNFFDWTGDDDLEAV
jgi:hypothetical protein